LFDTLQEEDPAEWTEPKIKECIVTGNKFNSRQINYLLNHGGFTKTTKDPDESKDLIECYEPTKHRTTGAYRMQATEARQVGTGRTGVPRSRAKY
jgi:hypothetical protein